MSEPARLLTEARLPGTDGTVDVLLADGRIAALGPAGSVDAVGAEPVGLAGRFLVPGLWDSHVHFTQWVIRGQRLDLAATTSAADVLQVVRDALPRSTANVLVGYGFRDGLWPDAPSVQSLDAVTGDRPAVMISGDLHCGWLNSAAAALIGVRTDPSGILAEIPWITALHALDQEAQPALADYRRASDAAAARGVVGIVDFEKSPCQARWLERAAAGVRALRVETSVWPDRLDEAIAAGYRTGQILDPDGLITVGRLKIVADGSLNTRTAWCQAPYPGLDPAAGDACGVESYPAAEIERLVGQAFAHGILPAVHAIGDRSNREVLDVFEKLGIAGTIEHAQLVAAEDFARFGRLGVIASVQPEHAMDDRDVADRYWAGRTGRSFAYRSLHDAGAVLHLGSDAPVAPLDPWLAMAAAVSRSRDGRPSWHPEQALSPEVALAASVRGSVAVGQPADLAVVAADPLHCPPETLRDMEVAATLVGGRFTRNAL